MRLTHKMDVNFVETVGMGISSPIDGSGGLLESFIGTIIDKTVISPKFDVDTLMIYPPPYDTAGHIQTMRAILAEACTDPDTYDAKTGLTTRGKMLLGHIYAPNGIGFADIMGQFCYKNAVKEWKKGNKNAAFVFLAYASHYIENVGIPLHAEADWRNLQTLLQQIGYHTYIEDWVSDNWTKMGFQAVADSAARVPMPVCDIGAMVRSLAMETYPDMAEWNKAWGQKGDGDYTSGGQGPANLT